MDWLPKTGPLGDFIDPGQAGLVIAGESKVEDAIKHAVTRAEEQTAQELDVDPKDVDKALPEDKPCQKLVKDMQPGRRGQRRPGLGQRLATHLDG